MSEFIVTNKTITIFVIIAGIIAVMIGVISYNAGVNYGLKQSTAPAASTQPPATDNVNTTTSAPASATVAEETVIAGEPYVADEQTTLIGEVSSITANSFKLAVTSNVLNQATGGLSDRVTNYTVTVNAQTKITEQTSTVEKPIGLEPAKVTTASKNLRLSNLEAGQTVQVVTLDDATSGTVLALSVTLNTQVIK